MLALDWFYRWRCRWPRLAASTLLPKRRLLRARPWPRRKPPSLRRTRPPTRAKYFRPSASSVTAITVRVTDEHIKKTIVEGGASVGKSPAMAANPDLADKPDVVTELVKIVRAFKH